MSSKSIERRIRLRNGTEFNVTFHRRSSSLVVIDAEERKPMRIRKETPAFAQRSVWAARVDGSGTTYYDANPARAFDICVRHCWRTALN